MTLNGDKLCRSVIYVVIVVARSGIKFVVAKLYRLALVYYHGVFVGVGESDEFTDKVLAERT